MAEPRLLLALYALNVVTMPWVVVALGVNVVQYLQAASRNDAMHRSARREIGHALLS